MAIALLHLYNFTTEDDGFDAIFNMLTVNAQMKLEDRK